MVRRFWAEALEATSDAVGGGGVEWGSRSASDRRSSRNGEIILTVAENVATTGINGLR